MIYYKNTLENYMKIDKVKKNKIKPNPKQKKLTHHIKLCVK